MKNFNFHSSKFPWNLEIHFLIHGYSDKFNPRKLFRTYFHKGVIVGEIAFYFSFVLCNYESELLLAFVSHWLFIDYAKWSVMEIIQ